MLAFEDFMKCDKEILRTKSDQQKSEYNRWVITSGVNSEKYF